MRKLKFGEVIAVQIDDVEIVAEVVDISVRENSREIVTYYTFKQISNEYVSFSLNVTEPKND